MYPILLKIGSFSISTLAVFLILGFIASAFVLYGRAKEEHIPEELSFDMFFLSIFFGLIVSRLSYVLFLSGDFTSPGSYFSIFNKPGFTYWGAGLSILLVLYLLLKKAKIDYFKFLDNFVFSALIFQIFLSLGLWFDGSYLGAKHELVLFRQKLVWQDNLSLYQFIFLMLVYFLLRKLSLEYRTYSWYKGKKGEAKPGFLLLFYLISYSLFRTILVFFRTDPLYLKSLELCVSLIVFLISTLLLYLRSGFFDQESFKQRVGGFGSRQKKLKNKTFKQTAEYRKREPKKRKKRSLVKAGKDARL